MKYDCYVQSHAAERVDQLTLVRQQYPELERDVRIFSSVGLLRPNKTVLAHCVHLHNEEISTLVDQMIGIAGCPLSNILYSHGIYLFNDICKRDFELVLEQISVEDQVWEC